MNTQTNVQAEIMALGTKFRANQALYTGLIMSLKAHDGVIVITVQTPDAGRYGKIEVRTDLPNAAAKIAAAGNDLTAMCVGYNYYMTKEA